MLKIRHMKPVFILLFLACFCMTGFSQIKDKRIVDKNGNVQLLGQLSEEALSSTPFSKWYKKEYKKYKPNDSALSKIDNLNQYEFMVFMGTWCGDSKREVPRLMKILNELDVYDEQITIVGVDRTKEAYKESPNGEEKNRLIHRVPTIIILNDGIEVNRIVESPIISLEEDILEIIGENEYRNQYIITDHLFDGITEFGLDYIVDSPNEVAELLRSNSKKFSELNTFGYTYLYNENYEMASAIFLINTKLYPEETRSFMSLGMAYFKNEQYNLAKEAYKRVMELDPENEDALKMLGRIALAE